MTDVHIFVLPCVKRVEYLAACWIGLRIKQILKFSKQSKMSSITYKVLLLLGFPSLLFAQQLSPIELNRCAHQAKQVTIIRDNWGIPHIYGKTDADAVFGLLYAQCEDDFPRIEMNYIEKLGRLSEIQGESMLYNDLQIRLLIDSTEAMQDFKKAESWLKKLLVAHIVQC
ncbi:MAG: penicillin acylase family protein [Saprospiraceae bacterium]|nr:penicillin acylase family protein [Saprospiraceae bacterium]